MINNVLDEELSNQTNAVQSEHQDSFSELARISARTALNFAFAFLRRAWRLGLLPRYKIISSSVYSKHATSSYDPHLGEDCDICSELLQETLEALQTLPEALLFDESKVSPVWRDVLEKSSSFLRLVVMG